jgi:uncharacterized lipoprotein YajG
MKKTLMLLGLGLGALMLSGCSKGAQTATTPSAAPASINTTLTGTVVKNGAGFVLDQGNRKTTAIDSYTQKFDAYVGKTITVTGQYSGTTLFVDVIK